MIVEKRVPTKWGEFGLRVDTTTKRGKVAWINKNGVVKRTKDVDWVALNNRIDELKEAYSNMDNVDLPEDLKQKLISVMYYEYNDLRRWRNRLKKAYNFGN